MEPNNKVSAVLGVMAGGEVDPPATGDSDNDKSHQEPHFNSEEVEENAESSEEETASEEVQATTGEDGEGSEGESTKQARDDDSEADQISLKTLADELNLDIKDLYNVQIGMGQGVEPITLGQLKDSYKELQHLEADKQAFTTSKMNQENEVLRARQELSYLVQNLPNIPDNYVEAIQAQQKQNLAREQQALLKALPEMADPAQNQAINQRVAEVATSYGFTPTELAYVQDHRIVKMLNDYGLLRAQIESANKQVKEVTRGPKKPSKGVRPSNKRMEKARHNNLVAKAKAGDRKAQQAALLNVLAGNR